MDAVNGCEKDVSFNAMVNCNVCDGTGAKPGTKPTNCKSCGGRGQTTVSNGFMTFSTICSSCHGEGKLIKDPCSTCRGSGVKKDRKTLGVKIPAGVESGNSVRLPGQGSAGIKGGRNGNLFLRITVEPHPVFKRNGNDIHVDTPITVSQALLGGKVTVPTLTGDVEIQVRVHCDDVLLMDLDRFHLALNQMKREF
jgi:molecular chaperone DnaJ